MRRLLSASAINVHVMHKISSGWYIIYGDIAVGDKGLVIGDKGLGILTDCLTCHGHDCKNWNSENQIQSCNVTDTTNKRNSGRSTQGDRSTKSVPEVVQHPSSSSRSWPGKPDLSFEMWPDSKILRGHDCKSGPADVNLTNPLSSHYHFVSS